MINSASHVDDFNTPLLAVRDLSVRFGSSGEAGQLALDSLSLTIYPNQTLALVGESGSGKSVTALAIMGLLPREHCTISPAATIDFNGHNLLRMPHAERRKLSGKDIAMVFQDPMSSLNPVLTVGYQIAEVLREHMGLQGEPARQRTLALLKEVGIPSPERHIDRYPSQLSGGQQQRIMIAMAIACEPKLLIADEPTTALDVTIQRQIMDLLADLQQRRHMAMLFITHDLALVHEIADNVIVLRHGVMREHGRTQELFSAPQDAYTKALLACRPTLDYRPRRLPVIQDFMEQATPNISADPKRSEQAFSFDRPSSNNLADDATPLLVVQGLSKYYFRREGFFRKIPVPAVDNVSFTLRRGKTLGIVGESGSGKSTLGMTLLRLHQASAGRVLFDGVDILSLSETAFLPYRPRLQIIFQNPYASLNPRFTIGDILLEPLTLHRIGADRQERLAIVCDLLQRVGVSPDSLRRYPHEFSGGQRQRIAIARCLTLRPDVLVCDESVSALDVSVQAQVLNLLKDLQDELGMSYVFISHDLAVIRHLADDVLVMQDGKTVEFASADELYQSPRQAYTRTLLAAIPTINRTMGS